MEKIIGIDLGSYNSVVSVYEGNEVKVMPNAEGNNTTPSYVAFTKEGEIKVGESAKRQANLNSENTIFNIKRLMGKSYDQVKHLKRPYKIVDNKGRAAVEVTFEGKQKVYSPEEISAMIIQKMKKTAEEYLGTSVKRAIITTPAFFNSTERESTKLAGEIAGLKVERIISEPTAASLNIKAQNKIFAVCDFGGCTTDLSIIDIGDSVYEILSTNGDLDLGGSLIDEAVVNYLADEFKKECGIDLRKDQMALQRIIDAAEKAKIELSSSMKTEINLPYITAVDGQPKHLVKNINRAELEKIMEPFLDKVIEISRKSIEMSKKSISDIDEIILVGGSNRIPLMQQKLEKLFGKPVNKSLNLDLCVSMGATVQGGVIDGTVKDILLLDVIPLSLGIETVGNIMTRMIEANTTIPTSKKEIFSTASDNQPGIECHVLQGERPMAKDNKTLGRFSMDVLPAQRGIPKIEIEFSIDANAILTVKAKDKGTGKEQSMKIEGGTKLSNEEIERMKQEAKDNAENDQKEKEKIETINQADNFIFATEKQLKEYAEKIPEDDKTKITEQLTLLKKAKESSDLVGIKSIMENVGKIWQEVSTKIYQNSNQAEQPKQEQSENKTEDTTETVDYEEIPS